MLYMSGAGPNVIRKPPRLLCFQDRVSSLDIFVGGPRRRDETKTNHIPKDKNIIKVWPQAVISLKVTFLPKSPAESMKPAWSVFKG